MEWNTDLIEAMELARDERPHRTWTMARHATNLENLKLASTNIHMNARGAVDETREHQFNEKRLVSSTTRPHEPRRCA